MTCQKFLFALLAGLILGLFIPRKNKTLSNSNLILKIKKCVSFLFIAIFKKCFYPFRSLSLCLGLGLCSTILLSVFINAAPNIDTSTTAAAANITAAANSAAAAACSASQGNSKNKPHPSRPFSKEEILKGNSQNFLIKL